MTLSWTTTLGRWLEHDNVSSVEAVRLSFGSAWAHSSPLLILLGCGGLVGLSFWFYLHWQMQGSHRIRLVLAQLRATALCMAFLILTDPALEVTFVSLPKPVLWLLLDRSDSMSIPDDLSPTERDSLAQVVDLDSYLKSQANRTGRQDSGAVSSPPNPQDAHSRVDYARALLTKPNHNLLQRLAERFRLRLFYFADTLDVRSGVSFDEIDGRSIARDWQTPGGLTALGDAFEDLARQHGADNPAAVLVFSDFVQNSGVPAVPAAKKLGVPVFTVGVGPLTAVDVSIDLIVPPSMKRGELSTINVIVRQRELDKPTVHVQLFAQQTDATDRDELARTLIGVKTVEIAGDSHQFEFPFTPDTAGQFVFTAQVDAVAGEVVVENNSAERDVKIIDDFLRLMFVEYEPTWEWRFLKEVFHRDRLVGTRGFRTFIRSADPAVRETNELFLPSLNLPRSQFFENDVLFLGDLPSTSLSNRFCEMAKEFVSEFGGGLVVIAGPRFGPGQLANTPLADLLPVVVDPDFQRQDQQEFRLRLTPAVTQFDFMRLGQSEVENHLAWNKLAKLPWYQPVRRIDTKGTHVLAEHPTETCVDGQTHQPLIAIRQYGRGEVVYIGFNEMWRLRRLHGEEYYRQFWGQLIHRLGLSHAIGNHKRFVVRTDKTKYRPDEQVQITVESYDQEFHPLDEKTLPQRQIMGEFLPPDRDSSGSQSFVISQRKPGIFETRLLVMRQGTSRLRVTDPISNEIHEIRFDVANVSLERQEPVRNGSLQENIAAETGAKTYDLTNVDQFPDDFRPVQPRETSLEILSLWNNWVVFSTLAGLLSAEWLVRKAVHLS